MDVKLLLCLNMEATGDAGSSQVQQRVSLKSLLKPTSFRECFAMDLQQRMPCLMVATFTLKLKNRNRNQRVPNVWFFQILKKAILILMDSGVTWLSMGRFKKMRDTPTISKKGLIKRRNHLCGGCGTETMVIGL